GVDEAGNRRRPWLAWRQALGIARRVIGARLWRAPLIVISHVPPAGVGDAEDIYHVGFDAYHWLLDRLAPPIWLHGHTTTASVTRSVIAASQALARAPGVGSSNAKPVPSPGRVSSSITLSARPPVRRTIGGVP